MAAEIAGGASLGTVFSELYKVVQTLARTSMHFSNLAEDIRWKLEHLIPLIQQIEEQNMELGLSNQYTEELKKEVVYGLELIGNCSRVKPYDVLGRRSYTKELRKLDGSLKKWLRILTLDGVRVGNETLLSVRMMKKMVLAIFVVALGKVTTTMIIIIRGSQKSSW